MPSYDPRRLQLALASLRNPGGTTATGRRLQDLMEWLLSEVPGVEIAARNKLDSARSEERDLWFEHDPKLSGLPFIDFSFPVECKNEARPASAAEVREFAAKIRDTGGFDGLLVATNGLSGADGRAAHDAVRIALSQRIRVTVLASADLRVVSTTDDLIGVIRRRLGELRLFRTYVSL